MPQRTKTNELFICLWITFENETDLWECEWKEEWLICGSVCNIFQRHIPDTYNRGCFIVQKKYRTCFSQQIFLNDKKRTLLKCVLKCTKQQRYAHKRTFFATRQGKQHDCLLVIYCPFIMVHFNRKSRQCPNVDFFSSSFPVQSQIGISAGKVLYRVLLIHASLYVIIIIFLNLFIQDITL